MNNRRKIKREPREKDIMKLFMLLPFDHFNKDLP